jgi:glycosyltransferase involved in cell wall biosynthesis
VSFLAWGAVSGRSREIADALGGEAHCLFPPESRWRPHPAVRYVLCTLDTIAYVARRRPRSLVVTNPPLIAGFVVLACARLLGCPVVLDSHPGAFGAQGDTFSARLQTLHRWLVRHVDGSMVASQKWVDIVEDWGGEAVEVHEAPRGLEAVARLAPASERIRIFCVGRLAPDEPFEEMVRAAALVPDCQFLVTGDVARAPDLPRLAAANVTFTGFLGPEAYDRELRDADVVMTLTTEPSSVMRAAYEAVYACRPLIVTDWPLDRELFPFAVHVHNDARDIAEGVRRARDDYASLARTTKKARTVQCRRWADQLPRLRRMLCLPPHEDDGSSHGSNASLGTPSPPPRQSRAGVMARIRRSLQKVQVST